MPKKERGHLTQGDRIFIEERLRDSTSIPDIASKLGVEPSTVRQEIQRNAVKESPSFLVVETRNICLRKDACKLSAICGNGCIMPCRTCKKSLCNQVCPEFKRTFARGSRNRPTSATTAGNATAWGATTSTASTTASWRTRRP